MHDTDFDQAIADWACRAWDLHWDVPFHTTFEPSTPAGQWFLGGMLNVSVNCLDRHLPERAEVPAFCWEGEPGDRRTITYADLHAEVVAFTRALRDLGLEAGDRVALYMGWLPETIVAMLACARIGAVHALLPAPLPADALADRLVDLEPKLLVTADGAWRHGMILPLKNRCDEALSAVASVEQTIVVRRTGLEVGWYEGDLWYTELIDQYRGSVSDSTDDLGRPESVAADHPLAIMYIASRRGRPTGIVHRSAGFLVAAAALHRHGFAASDEDVLWCAVEFSWVVAQTHAVYGPLACGATTVMYEGTLDTPTHARPWEIIERYGVTTVLTTPSVVRNIRSWVDSPPGKRAASVRRICTGGENIDPETQAWLAQEVGQGQATIVNVWGQTELGGAVRVRPWMLEGLPDPGLAILDGENQPVPDGTAGELVLTHPWPGLFLGHHHGQGKIEFDADRGNATMYRTGDAARVGSDGLIWILGRMDPLISVAAQLVSATEIVDVLVEHPFVRAAEVISRPDRRKGRAVVACVVLERHVQASSAIAAELRTHVHDTLGGLATPRAIAFCDDFPAGVTREVLRRALWTLCARRTSPAFHLSATQIQTAVTAVGLELS